MVVSLSPHLAATHSSLMSHSTRTWPEVWWTNSLALRDAAATVAMSPLPSIQKPATGFPVFAMPSTMRCVQPGSMPMTMQAATFGLEPVPIIVRKCRSRSAPNCRRP